MKPSGTDFDKLHKNLFFEMVSFRQQKYMEKQSTTMWLTSAIMLGKARYYNKI